ncbi:unnamed protein product [Acanthoscelides obtectus]|nr:unnamed protein product [Acanthoscelides obtectus]CAK1679001.1 hypothetical protein AOBTE_LOCUS32089 [Acanthoscelides obtectus]
MNYFNLDTTQRLMVCILTIEHMWDTLGRRLRQYYGEFQTVAALEQAMANEWGQIPQNTIAREDEICYPSPGRKYSFLITISNYQ